MRFDDIDRRFVTDKFLDRFFPVPHKEEERLYIDEQLQKYRVFRNEINQKRRLSGHSTISDANLTTILEEYYKYSKKEKPSSQ